ncbi:hypothetical protein V3C99_005140 [Haemonchus contortus]
MVHNMLGDGTKNFGDRNEHWLPNSLDFLQKPSSQMSAAELLRFLRNRPVTLSAQLLMQPAPWWNKCTYKLVSFSVLVISTSFVAVAVSLTMYCSAMPPRSLFARLPVTFVLYNI